MNIQNMYFHGISFLNWEVVPDISYLELLESILRDGALLTRDKLWEVHPEYLRCLRERSYQGNNEVCICCHSAKNDDYLQVIGKNYFEEYAFDFVYNNYSIILDDHILQDFSYVQSGMVGEFEVLGNISLKYMRGIGMPNEFERMLFSVLKILNKNDCFNSKLKNDFYVHRLRMIDNIDHFLNEGYYEMGFHHYCKVKELLRCYGYDVPIVDPETGLEWRSQEEVYQDVVRVQSLARRRKLI